MGKTIFKKLDIYIARNFLGTLLIITGAALGLYMAADVVRGMDDYLREGDPFLRTMSRIGLTYLVRTPVFLTPLIPMTILVAGAFSIAYLARNNEITAMKASGISLFRILVPLFVSATLVSIVGFLNQELVVPYVELKYQPVLKELSGEEDKYEDVGRFILEENTMYMASYNLVNEMLLDPNVIFYDLNNGEDFLRIKAKKGRFDGNGWTLYEELEIGGKRSHDEEFFWETGLTPERLAMEVLPRQSRPLPVIIEHIRSETEHVSDYEQERKGFIDPTDEVLLYSRISYPLVGVVLLLAGIPLMLSSEDIRRSRLFGVGLCILVGGVYYTLSFLCTALGEGGALMPELAGFLPVILLGAVGIYLSDKIRT